jgi:hypothetical protein
MREADMRKISISGQTWKIKISTPYLNGKKPGCGGTCLFIPAMSGSLK